MIKVDWSGAKELEKALTKFAAQGIPHAARNALNETAFIARREWVELSKRSMVMRNSYTERSIQYQKATGTAMATMQSKVGSTAEYMARRETDVTKTGTGHVGVAIPTPVAAGQTPGTRPRTKAVRAPNRLSRITLAKRPGSTPSQRNAMALRLAAKGGKFAFLELGKRKVIVKATGKRKLKIQTIWDLSKKSVHVRARPTLQQTLDAIEPKLPAVYVKALMEQMRRAGAYGTFQYTGGTR